MNQRLDELLKRCTVKLSVPGKSGWGTGFFVAPQTVLTCAHVVKDATEQRIHVFWQQQTYEAVVEWLPDDSRQWDLALLQLKEPFPSHPCVYLDVEVRPDDDLYTFGYPDDSPDGVPATFETEGLTGGNAFIKFKAGQVRPGLSGSPLLNQRTGKVCGVVKFTRDRSSDLGGGAVPIIAIFFQRPELQGKNQQFHQSNTQWTKLLPKSSLTETEPKVRFRRKAILLSSLFGVGIAAIAITMNLPKPQTAPLLSQSPAPSPSGSESPSNSNQPVEFAIAPQFDSADPFFQGLAAVEVDGKWGYIDTTGKLVIPTKFDSADPFTEDGIAGVKTGNRWTFIDKNGSPITQTTFDKTSLFKEGLAAVKLNNKWGYIDTTGRLVIELHFNYADSFHAGLAIVSISNKFGFIRKDGKIAIQPEFDDARSFSEDLAVVKKGDKWGYIDKTGKFVIKPSFYDANAFSDGLAAVKVKSEPDSSSWGYINRHFDESSYFVIRPQYYGAYFFSKNVALVLVKESDYDYKYYCINKEDERIVNLNLFPDFKKVNTYSLSFSEGLVEIKIGDKWGYIDQAGNWVIKPQFTSAQDFSEGLAAVSTADKSGYNKWGYIRNPKRK